MNIFGKPHVQVNIPVSKLHPNATAPNTRSLYNFVSLASALSAAKSAWFSALQDVQYGDIDYMDERRIFTLGEDWADLPEYVQQLKLEGTRFVIILVNTVLYCLLKLLIYFSMIT